MKGDQPHAGFPEKNYEAHGERLARAGHRTVIIEQTETPEALDARKKATGAKDKVVRREKVALLTRGTLTDATMLAATPDAAYLVAITETACGDSSGDGDCEPDGVVIGLCAADCGTGRLLLGGWTDCGARSRLRAILAELRPVEAVLPRGALSPATLAALRATSRPAVERALPPGGDGFWDAHRTLEELDSASYFAGGRTGASASRGRYAGWPAALADAAGRCAGLSGAAAAAPAAAAMSALGGVTRHLRDSLIDHDILALGHVTWLPGADSGADSGDASGAASAAWASRGAVALDGSALTALEVLENSEGGAAGSLLAAVDRCASGAGRRRLRAWLCRPLRDAAAVAQRQAAVADLKDRAAEAVGAARKALRGAPDLERAVGAHSHRTAFLALSRIPARIGR
jgi:DNA mismatch repair protein MSH6